MMGDQDIDQVDQLSDKKYPQIDEYESFIYLLKFIKANYKFSFP